VPAATVIPPPIAHIKVVAVKKLEVKFWARVNCQPLVERCVHAFLLGSPMVVNSVMVDHRPFTLKKIECSKQVVA
jgi:hypothetical protein